jgi:hypothetical protein
VHLLLALLLAAEPETARVPSHAIWLDPAAMIYSAVLRQPGLILLDTPQIYGLGGQFAATQNVALTLQLAAISPSMIKSESIVSPAYLLTASPGLLVSLWGNESLKGFFVQARVAISYGQAWQRATISRSPVPLTEGLAIVDLGFHWRWRRLYFATVLGAGAGVCVGCPPGPQANAQQVILTGAIGLVGNSRLVWAVDLDFLRIGIAL